MIMPRQVRAALDRITMKVPQIQFFDVKVVVQFLDSVLAGPVLCNDSVDAPGVVYGGFGQIPHFLHDAGPWTIFLRAPVSGSAVTFPGVHSSHSSVNGCFWVNFTLSTRRFARGRSHVEIWTVSQRALRMAVWIGGGGAFSVVLTPFFALRPVGRRVPSFQGTFWEPSMANSCWSSRALVAQWIATGC